MEKIFKMLKFTQKRNFAASIQHDTLEFYIPGVNSGAYDATIHVAVTIEEHVAGFFRILPRRSSMQMTLSAKQFDELFLEMQKIKKLRDGLEELKKENKAQ